VLRALARVMTLLDMWVRAAWRSTIRLRRTTDAASKKSDRRQHLNAGQLRGSARPVLVCLVAVGSLLLAADTLLQAGGGSWSAMLPSRWGKRASGEGANSTTVVAAESAEHQARDELARFRIDPRTSSAFHRLEQWAYRSDRGGGSGGSGGGQATIEAAVVEARRVQHAVQARLARLNAQAALLQTYLGVGGAGGDTEVVLWLRLARGDGDQTGATAVAAISKMRNSLPLSLEVESGWSLEGARVLPPHSSLPPLLTHTS
jgi:hypothetical protein